jgi:3-hydroxyacyl-[acyl-carrier-protein] dehydratase
MDKLIDTIVKSELDMIKEDDPVEITGRFCFKRGFIGFSGHFPGYPLLPAVIQLLTAQILVERQKGCRIKVTLIEKAKFLSEIRPGDHITVKCADVTADGNQKSKVIITSGDKTVSSFTLNFSPLKEDMKC